MGQPAGVRAAGAIFFLAFAAIWAGGAYWLWPDGVSDIPLSGLTLGSLFRAGAAVVFCLLSIGCIIGAIRDAFD